MNAENPIPRVLLTCPVSDRHSHLLDEWIKHLDDLTYPNIEVCLVDTTDTSDDYFKRIKKLKVHGKKIKAIRHKWNPDKWHPVQMLAHAREKAREYFLENDFDYLFCLDDDIFIPKNGVQRLISYNKDCVGFYVHVFPKGSHVPCVLKSGEIIMGKGLDYYTFAEITSYKQFAKRFTENQMTSEEKRLSDFMIEDKFRPYLFKTYAVGLGCSLLKRKVLEEVHFRTHPTFIFGEDLWFFAEANEKGFEFWCDSRLRCRHENTDWDPVVRKSRKQMEFFLLNGPADATEAVMVNREKKK